MVSVRLLMIDGDAEEVTHVLNNASIAQSAERVIAPAAAGKSPAAVSANGDDEKIFVTTEVARRVFKRRPLSKEQKRVLLLLVKAYPDWMSATELQTAIDYSPAQFAGLMGAYGRRLSHTDGYVNGSWLFDAEWNYENKCYDYRLPETVRKAIDLEGIA
jgi:predicted transcriptional regulator with HTH domain